MLGRDPRASGVMIREGVVAGLLACGHDVIDLGIAPTPVIQHAIRRLDAAGGISIGASHNTAEWNALRILRAQGTYLSTAEANELLDIYHLRKFRLVEWDARRQAAHQGDDAIDRVSRRPSRPSTIFDALRRSFAWSSTAATAHPSLILRPPQRALRLRFILINEKLEGVALRARALPPRRDTVALQLAPLMRPLSADAGFLFDVDSDRVAHGGRARRAVSEEMVLPLLADYLLPRGPGKLVITNLSTTALLEDIAARHGGKVVRVPVGTAGGDRRAAAAIARAGRAGGRRHGRGDDAAVPVRLRRHRLHAGGPVPDARARQPVWRNSGRLSDVLDPEGEVPLVSPRIPALLTSLRERYPDGTRQRGRRPARGLARPLVPRARQPDRADRPRDLRAAGRAAGRAVRQRCWSEVRSFA